MKTAMMAALALALSACGMPEAAPVAADEGVSFSNPLALDRSPPRHDFLPRERIYYDLTRFEWYARGEPLRSAGIGYQPAGLPVAAPLTEMQRVGEYEGVEYYHRAGADGLLFVPVFEGYWLAFRAVPGTSVAAD